MKKTIFLITTSIFFIFTFLAQGIMIGSGNPVANVQKNGITHGTSDSSQNISCSCHYDEYFTNYILDQLYYEPPLFTGLNWEHRYIMHDIDNSVLFYNISKNVQISNITLNSAQIIIDNCTNITFSNCVFNDSNIEICDYSNNITIENCSISQSDEPIQINLSSKILIENNTFRNDYHPFDFFGTNNVLIYLNQFFTTIFGTIESDSDSDDSSFNTNIEWDNGTIGNCYDNYLQMYQNANFTFPPELNLCCNKNEKIGIGNYSYNSDRHPYQIFRNEKPTISLLYCPDSIFKNNPVHLVFEISGLIKNVKILESNNSVFYNDNDLNNGLKIFNLTIQANSSMKIMATNWFGLSTEIPVNASLISQFSIVYPINESEFSKAPSFRFNMTGGSYSYLINNDIRTNNISEIWNMLKDSRLNITVSNSLLNMNKTIHIIKDTTSPVIRVEKINSDFSRIFVSDQNYAKTKIEFINNSVNENNAFTLNYANSTILLNSTGFSGMVIIISTDMANNTATLYLNCFKQENKTPQYEFARVMGIAVLTLLITIISAVTKSKSKPKRRI